MHPAFRGTNLDIPNYDRESIEEIAFLISNKKAENFKLEIASIILFNGSLFNHHNTLSLTSHF